MTRKKKLKGIVHPLLNQFAQDLIALSLEDRDLPHSERDVSIFLRLTGFDGHLALSRREAAELFCLSAERIRQVHQRFIDQFIPVVSQDDKFNKLRALFRDEVEKIKVSAPATTESIAMKFGSSGHSEGNYPALVYEALVRVAELLDVNDYLQIEDWYETKAIVHKGVPTYFSPVISLSRKLWSASGAFSISLLAEFLDKTQSIYLSEETIDQMISPFATFVGMESPDLKSCGFRWYTYDKHGSDAITRVQKRVGSLGWCSLDRINGGEGSHSDDHVNNQIPFTRSKYMVHVPRHILKPVLEMHGMKVEGDRVSLRKRTKSMQLSKVQDRMISILKEMTSDTNEPVKQVDFLRVLAEKGININTARIYLYRRLIFKCKGGMCELSP